MARVKAIVSLIATAIVVALSISLISSGVSAQDSEEPYTSAPPIILIYKNENDGLPIDYQISSPVIRSDTGNVTVWIKILMPYQVYNAKLHGTVMWLGGYLTSVSYKASWHNNQTVYLYTNTSSNGLGQYDFNLTNIPYGNHHLEVNASNVVLIMDSWSPVTSHPFYDTNRYSLNFTVAPNHALTPAPTPTPSHVIIVAVGIVVAVIVVVFYRKHRSPQLLKASDNHSQK